MHLNDPKKQFSSENCVENRHRFNKSRQISNRLPSDVESWTAFNIFQPDVRSSTRKYGLIAQIPNGTESFAML